MGAGHPELVEELKSCKEQQSALQAEITAIERSEPTMPQKINRNDIDAAVRNLRTTLSETSPEKLKEALQEDVTQIRIPPKGNALLEVSPAGLLSRCFLIVTPRGVDTEAQLFPMKTAV